MDVGGGRGRLIVEVLRRHPGWRGVLFDREHVVAGHELATLGADDRWEIASGDFFHAVPEGGDLYSMQYILHDWDDDGCVRILENCRRAMKPGGRVVALDTVVPESDDPHPGKGIDVLLLGILPGRERTEAEFAALFDAAGLRLRRATRKPDPGWLSIIEAEEGVGISLDVYAAPLNAKVVSFLIEGEWVRPVGGEPPGRTACQSVP